MVFHSPSLVFNVYIVIMFFPFTLSLYLFSWIVIKVNDIIFFMASLRFTVCYFLSVLISSIQFLLPDLSLVFFALCSLYTLLHFCAAFLCCSLPSLAWCSTTITASSFSSHVLSASVIFSLSSLSVIFSLCSWHMHRFFPGRWCPFFLLVLILISIIRLPS